MLWPILANSLTAAASTKVLKVLSIWKLSGLWQCPNPLNWIWQVIPWPGHTIGGVSIPFCKKSVTSVMSILSMMNLSILKVSQFHSSFWKTIKMLIIYEKCTFEICSSRKLIFWCHILLELCFVESNNLAQWLVVMVFMKNESILFIS